jgi:hypothetical protein
MKTLIATVALAAVIAAPALAQTNTTTARQQRAEQALSQSDAFARAEIQRRAVNSPDAAYGSPNVVYDGGQYIGADPDPNVRLNLRMDYEHRDF